MSSGKGGGGGGTNANDLAIAEQQRQEREQNKAREEANRTRMLTDRLATFRANADAAVPAATQRYRTSLENRGITGRDQSDVVSRALANAWRSVPQDTSNIDGFDVNVNSYFSDDLLDDVLSDVTGERRTRYGNQVANTFATGRENEALSLTADDPFVQSFLGSQRTDAQSMLERARARGNLDQTGYDRGLARLDELGTAGFSEADAITNAIIEGGRANLRGIANRAGTEAGAFELGRQWSIDPYQEEWDNTLSSFTNGLEGRVRSSLEGQNFFDIGDIITQAGIRQGAQNPTQAQADAVAARRDVRDANRGLGGAGQF